MDAAFEGPATDEEAAVKPAIAEFVVECESISFFLCKQTVTSRGDVMRVTCKGIWSPRRLGYIYYNKLQRG